MIGNEIREALKTTCSVLNKYEVEFIIIGGTAVGFHGYQRISGGFNPEKPETKTDIDFWYKPTLSNFLNLVKALKALNVDTIELEELVFNPKKTFLRIPHKTFKTEFLPEILGLNSFDEAFKDSKKFMFDGNQLNIISYKHLLLNKSAVNRPIDKIDIAELKKVNKNKLS